MTGSSVLAFAALLVGVLLLVIALVVWQEARRRPAYEPLEYVVEDAVRHVEAGLKMDGAPDLSRSDIRRILEWEVFYLQGLAQTKRSTPVETIAGGHRASIEYIVGEIAEKHGMEYSPQDVERVLHHEADYLLKIGAVGDPVDDRGGEEE